MIKRTLLPLTKGILTRRNLLASAGGISFIQDPAPSALTAQAAGESLKLPQEKSLISGHLELKLRIDNSGLAITSIANLGTGVQHLSHPSPLFGIFSNTKTSWYRSDKDFHIEEVHAASDRSLVISGRAIDLPIRFRLSINAEPQQNIASFYLELGNEGATPLELCRVRPLWIEHLSLQGATRNMYAALPQEAAGVISTGNAPAHLGMMVNPKLGLPTAMNTIEALSLYDPDGHGGVFFQDAEADLDKGTAPLQLTFIQDVVSGHALINLKPSESHKLPGYSIGVHDSGDWHVAVDAYIARHRTAWRYPDIPAWFREQGAIYSFSGSGAGAIYMQYPQQNLADRISSFHQLPRLLDEAMQLGTNIVYLWDYWEGTRQGDRPAYWNKGDYLPRVDLGGAAAFKEGIRQIHERGGRVILYIEPFIIFRFSGCGKEHGEAWAGRRPNGTLYDQYPQNYAMISCFAPWQEFITQKAKSLVENFAVDGIYLDSWGWQLNWPMKTAAGYTCTPLQYSEGVLALASKIREAIRSVRPDSIVMGESTSGALSRYWDGGLSADFAWLAAQNQNRIIASPVRYGMPAVNIFSNGRNLNELNQVFAAGHSLALLNANLPDAAYIRKLVEVRQRYKDALIYGMQLCQPKTTSEAVPAYYYRGSSSHIITAVNTSAKAYSGTISLQGVNLPSSSWRNLLTDQPLTAKASQLLVDLPGHSLLVLALV